MTVSAVEKGRKATIYNYMTLSFNYIYFFTLHNRPTLNMFIALKCRPTLHVYFTGHGDYFFYLKYVFLIVDIDGFR